MASQLLWLVTMIERIPKFPMHYVKIMYNTIKVGFLLGQKNVSLGIYVFTLSFIYSINSYCPHAYFQKIVTK